MPTLNVAFRKKIKESQIIVFLPTYKRGILNQTNSHLSKGQAMKKYSNLGDLLIDYRNLFGISQHDFAASLDVDVRTIQRWEKNTTLVKMEKEADLVDVTFLPHQLIRNLNTITPIPTFFDFRIRKYSLTELTKNLPEVEEIKNFIDFPSNQLRAINIETDLTNIKRYIDFQYENKNIINDDVLIRAIKLIPDANLLLTDMAGSYAGHCTTLPISNEAYQKLRDKIITNNELTLNDIVDYRLQKRPIFYGYNITADSNDGVYYIMGGALKFFRDLDCDNSLYCAISNRHDSINTVGKLGMTIIWEEQQSVVNRKSNPNLRFFEGDFKAFFSTK